MENVKFGLAGYGLIIATLDKLSAKGVISEKETAEIVKLGAEKLEQIKQPSGMAEIGDAAKWLRALAKEYSDCAT